MAIYEADVEWIADGSSPRVIIPPVAHDSDVEGLKYNDAGVIKGGFEGYCDGELTRVRKEISSGAKSGTVRVYLHTSPEKMVRWHNDGWQPADAKEAKKKFTVKGLASEKAVKEKDKLIDFNETVSDNK